MRSQLLLLGLAVGLAWDLLGSGGVPAAHAATFTVESQTDAVDANPGDGVCATAPLPSESVRCTLRAAVMEANALAGPDIISLSAGTYHHGGHEGPPSTPDSHRGATSHTPGPCEARLPGPT